MDRTGDTKREAVTFALRKASLTDASVLERLIGESVRELSRHDYTDAQIEAALGTAFGLDRELIRDGTYFVAEAANEIIGCGGWSRRKTLFGGDQQADRESELLDPARDSRGFEHFSSGPIGCDTESDAHSSSAARPRHWHMASAQPNSWRHFRGIGYIERLGTSAMNARSIGYRAASLSNSYP